MNLSELLHKRRSTRHYDANTAIERDELTRLLDAACRAPSGNNAQPWRFLIITETALREKLLPVAYNQQQILTASAIVLLLADRRAYQRDNLARIHQEGFENGCFSAEVRDFLTEAAVGFYASLDNAETDKALMLDCGLWGDEFHACGGRCRLEYRADERLSAGGVTRTARSTAALFGRDVDCHRQRQQGRSPHLAPSGKKPCRLECAANAGLTPLTRPTRRECL